MPTFVTLIVPRHDVPTCPSCKLPVYEAGTVSSSVPFKGVEGVVNVCCAGCGYEGPWSERAAGEAKGDGPQLVLFDDLGQSLNQAVERRAKYVGPRSLRRP